MVVRGVTQPVVVLMYNDRSGLSANGRLVDLAIQLERATGICCRDWCKLRSPRPVTQHGFLVQGCIGDLTTNKRIATGARDCQGQQLSYFVDGIKGSQSQGSRSCRASQLHPQQEGVELGHHFMAAAAVGIIVEAHGWLVSVSGGRGERAQCGWEELAFHFFSSRTKCSAKCLDHASFNTDIGARVYPPPLLFDFNPRTRRRARAERNGEREGNWDLEDEIIEFMRDSEHLDLFPTKKQLIDAERMDLVEAVTRQGGWLSLGWNLDGQDKSMVQDECDSRDFGYAKSDNFDLRDTSRTD
ncbi:hypothetical protein NL676_034822 [Syzygium grande]|nr:hypothetical protein NL676_034822 [Syzygium grande]